MGLQDGSKDKEPKGDLENTNPTPNEVTCFALGQRPIGRSLTIIEKGSTKWCPT